MLLAIRSQMILKLFLRKNIPIRINIGQQNILRPGNLPKLLRAELFLLLRASIRMITAAEIPIGPLDLFSGSHRGKFQYFARFNNYFKPIHKIVDG